MKLKTNSKKAIQNIKRYIIEHFDPSNYSEYAHTNTEDFSAVANVIYNCFMREKFYTDEAAAARGIRLQDEFIEWAQGLPSIIDTCYYYNRSAVDDLAAILEESDEEKAQYSESKAAQLLTSLIYLHIITAVRRSTK